MFDKIIKAVGVIALAVASIGVMIWGVNTGKATEPELTQQQKDYYAAQARETNADADAQEIVNAAARKAAQAILDAEAADTTAVAAAKNARAAALAEQSAELVKIVNATIQKYTLVAPTYTTVGTSQINGSGVPIARTGGYSVAANTTVQDMTTGYWTVTIPTGGYTKSYTLVKFAIAEVKAPAAAGTGGTPAAVPVTSTAIAGTPATYVKFVAGEVAGTAEQNGATVGVTTAKAAELTISDAALATLQANFEEILKLNKEIVGMGETALVTAVAPNIGTTAGANIVIIKQVVSANTIITA